jgi:hypothetical protein
MGLKRPSQVGFIALFQLQSQASHQACFLQPPAEIDKVPWITVCNLRDEPAAAPALGCLNG